ncbi:hypothetical protein CLOP_g801 [Closterium sp. NIES-67]|nr:hypothetical protein CLOP_g801 [Closterium sp. NIES-67]
MASRRFLGLVLLVLATSWFLTSCAASIAAKSGAAGASQGSSSKNSKSGAKSAPTGSTTGSSKTPPGTGAKIAGGGSKNPGNPGKTNSSLTAFFKAVAEAQRNGLHAIRIPRQTITASCKRSAPCSSSLSRCSYE